MTGSSDDATVRRAKAGDQAAWRDLYEANAGRLVVWLRSRPSGDAAADCEDVAAEAWLTAARKIGEFSGGAPEFAGWLFAIARNIAVNAHRRTQRRATSAYPVGLHDTAIWGTTPDLSGHVDGTDWTRQLLSRLPPREAEVVACIDVVGLDIATTSQALGISVAAVRISHLRGLGRLRDLFLPAAEPNSAGGARVRLERSHESGSAC